MEDDGEAQPPLSEMLSRDGRRNSISMPQGLDLQLLLKIAEHSWVSQ